MSFDDGDSFARYLDAKFGDHLAVLLRSEDRNSMASGVECRLPFLDHRLVAFARGLPFDFLLRGGWTKAVLRESVRDIVPRAILRRRMKLGFPGPMEDTPRPDIGATHRAWRALERDGWVRGDFPVDPRSDGGKRLGLRARITEAWLRVCVA
jgi:asparagine synthetase B (glutamine-hydrolysing)